MRLSKKLGNISPSFLCLSLVLFISIFSPVFGGPVTNKGQITSVDATKSEISESRAQTLENLRPENTAPKHKATFQKLSRRMDNKSSPRTINPFERIFETLGMGSMTVFSGLRSLMNMSNTGTQFEFVPLGMLMWRRFFGELGADSILGF